MKTHTSPSSLLRAQVERFRRFEGTQVQLHEEMVAAAKVDHLELTSGSISTATFRRLGHPLARDGGLMRGASASLLKAAGLKGSVPLLPINRQSGRLQASLKVEGPSGPNRAYKVGFTAPYAKFVLAPGGTSRMVARGFFEELRKRNAARLHGQLLKARDEQRKA